MKLLVFSIIKNYSYKYRNTYLPFNLFKHFTHYFYNILENSYTLLQSFQRSKAHIFEEKPENMTPKLGKLLNKLHTQKSEAKPVKNTTNR